MNRDEKLIRDLVNFYNKHQRSPHMAGAGILKGLKQAFKKVVQLGQKIISNKDLQEMVKGCIKKVVKDFKGAGVVNDDPMILEFVDIYKRHRPHQQEMKGGILGVMTAILSGLAQAGAVVGPPAIKAIKSCVLGAIDAKMKDKRGGVIPVRYNESNFKSSFQEDGKLKTNRANRLVGGANPWIEFSRNIKKGESGMYKGQKYQRNAVNGRLEKV
jgi:hypothetical protein